MNKRITSILLCFVLLVSMMVTAVPTYAASAKEVVFKADKTEAHPGDTITYTVTLGPIEHLNNGGFFLVIPEGLTFVEAKVPEGLKNTLAGSGALEWTESTLNLGWYGDADYTSTGDTLMLTFTCKVDEGASGVKKITLDGDEDLGNTSFQSIEGINWNLSGTEVNITPKPVAVTGVTLDVNRLSLKTGESDTLVATVEPDNATNKNVEWYSSNEAVAKVDSTGKVTAASSIAPNKTATATITVKTVDGGKQATCVVTVNCAHASKTNHPEKNDATCQEQNYSEYNSCDACGQLFKADGTTEISAVPYTGAGVNHVGTANEYVSNGDDATHKVQYSGCHHIATASQNCSGGTNNCQTKATCDKCGQLWGTTGGHVWGTTYELANSDANKHYKVCTVSGCGEKDEGQTHNYDDASDMLCNDCSYDRSHHCGSGVQHIAKAADCAAMTDGNILYYECSCGKKYDNVLCTGDPLTEPEITVSWKHTLGHVNEEKYCYKEGVVEHYHCSDCGKNFATNDNRATTALATIVAPATGEHDFTGPWTDGNDGKHYHYCQNTGCTNKDAGEAHSGGTATCLNGKICTDCSAEYTDKDAEAHTMPGEYKYEKNNDGTHKKFNKCCSALVKADEACEYGADEICDLCEYDKTHVCGDGELNQGWDEGCGWDGQKDYYECSCGLKYYDALCKRPVENEDDLVLPRTGDHVDEDNNHWCDKCQAGLPGDQPGDKPNDKPDDKPNDEPGNKPDDKVDSPQTGDNSNMMLWIALAFVSAASLAGLTVYGKKKKYQE